MKRSQERSGFLEEKGVEVVVDPKLLVGSPRPSREVRRDHASGRAAHTGWLGASSTVRDLVAGAGLTFVDRGPAELKSLSEPMRLFAAVT